VAGGSREAAGKGAASRGHSVPREKGEEEEERATRWFKF
jgi:hypothetical protein